MTESTMPLYRVCRPPRDVTSEAALVSFARTVAVASIGFGYSPVAARWFRLDPDGSAWSHDRRAGRRPFDLTGVFELRAFTPTHELRWHNTTAQTGPAVIVGDGTAAAPDAPRRLAEEPYQRLLWGEIATHDQRGGWATLRDGRIGTLDVPVDAGRLGAAQSGPARVWLRAVEYVTEDDHGNVAVVDERLVDLVVNPEQPARPDREASA